MNYLDKLITEYMEHCKYRRALDCKTLKAYSIDLNQYRNYLCISNLDALCRTSLIQYLTELHKTHKPKTVKRKIVSIKAFFHYLEYEEILEINPFNKINVRFREPQILPKTIPFHIIQSFLTVLYKQKNLVHSKYEKNVVLRDIAVIELLFATGVRISELCSLTPSDIDLTTQNLLIYGKGAKERLIQIGNSDVIEALTLYQTEFANEITSCGYFFVNRLKKDYRNNLYVS